MPRSCGPGLVLILVLLPLPVLAQTWADAPDERRRLQSVLRQELARILDEPRPWSELPPNISRVTVSPEGVPWFSGYRFVHSSTIPLAAAASDWQPPEPGVPFRLIPGGAIDDWAPDGSAGLSCHGGFIVFRGDDPRGDETSGDEAEAIPSINEGRVSRAFFSDGRWVFLGRDARTKSGNLPNFPPALLGAGSRVRIAHDRQRFLAFRPARTRPPRPLILAHSVPGTDRVEVIEHTVPPGDVEAVILGAQGGGLAVGARITPLSGSTATPVSEDDLLAALQLAEAGELAAFEKTLERVTLEQAARIAGFADLLGKIDSSEKLPVSGVTLSTAARFIRDGRQLFRGRWLGNREIVEQPALSRLIVLQMVFTPQEPSVARLILEELSATGEHRTIAETSTRELSWTLSPPSLIRDGEGWLLFAPRRGLGVLRDGRLEWIDESAKMKSMTQLLARDGTGRIYLAGRDHALWVFRRAKAPAPTPLLEFASTSPPQSDTGEGFWYTAPELGYESRGGIESRLELSDRGREFTVHSREHRQSGRPDQPHTLCRYVPGRARAEKLVSDRCLVDATCFPGRNGSVLVAGPTCVHLLASGQAHHAGSLKGLVESQPELFLENAPRITLPRRLESRTASRWISWVRWGDDVWVARGSHVNAFRAGKPLDVSRRLAIRNVRLRGAFLVGPLGSAENQRLLIVPATQSRTVYWARRNSEGTYTIEDDPLPRESPMIRMDHPPVISPQGEVFVQAGRDSCWKLVGAGKPEWLRDTGLPVLALRDGGLLVMRDVSRERGFMIARGAEREWIELTFGSRVILTHEDPDGSLVGTSPLGIVWLARNNEGRWGVKREVPVETSGRILRHVGRAGEHHLLETSDGFVSVRVR